LPEIADAINYRATGMARDLLNHWPDSVLGVVFIGGSVILTLGGLALVRRFLPGWRVVDSVDHVIGVAAMVMTLFALILAFVLFNLNLDLAAGAGSRRLQ
jgi:hypothetical protein